MAKKPKKDEDEVGTADLPVAETPKVKADRLPDLTTTRAQNVDTDAPCKWIKNPAGAYKWIPTDYVVPWGDLDEPAEVFKLAAAGLGGWAIPTEDEIPDFNPWTGKWKSGTDPNETKVASERGAPTEPKTEEG